MTTIGKGFFQLSMLLFSAGVGAQGFDATVDLGNLRAEQGVIIDGPLGGHLLGTSAAGNGDFNGDGFADLLLTAPGADVGPAVNSGEIFVVYGGKGTLEGGFDLNLLRSSNGGDGSLGVVIQGELSVFAGGSSDFVGDINGDGIDDILLGAPNSGTGFGQGGGYLVFGRPDSDPMPAEFSLSVLRGNGTDNVNSGFGVVLFGSQVTGNVGFRVAGIGDVNGDGINDMVLGNNLPLGSNIGNNRSALTFLPYGRDASTPWPAILNMVNLQSNLGDGSEGIVITSNAPANGLGTAVAGIGDFTGDGIDDFLLGARTAAENGTDSGGGYLIPGRISNPTEGWQDGLNLRNGDERVGSLLLTGPFENDFVGISVAGIGDVNGDGAPDVALGGEFSQIGGERSGIVYVLYGESDGAVSDSFQLGRLLPGNGGNGARGFVVAGASGEELGSSIAGLGDISGDGIDDFVIGASEMTRGGSRVGGAYVVFGRGAADPFPAQISVEELNSGTTSRGFRLRGESDGDQAGNWVNSAGDINGDGRGDILVSAPFADNGGSSAGRVYIVYGQGVPAAAPTGFRGQDTRAWFDPDRSGEGVLTEFGTFNGEPAFFAAWYTYQDGEQFWLVTDLTSFEVGDDSMTASLFRTTGGQFGQAFDTEAVNTIPWGTVEVVRGACDQLIWRYAQTDGESGELQFSPLLPSPETCAGDAKALNFGDGLGQELAGTWWNPDRAGEGIVLDIRDAGSQPTLFFSWFTYFEGEQLWVVGSTPIDTSSTEIVDIPLLVTRGTGFGTAFEPGEVIIEDWGTATLRFTSCNGAELDYQRSFPESEIESGNIALQRFTDGLLSFDCLD